jgi:Saxitoxin biosynthesis operon protein SxtJ
MSSNRSLPSNRSFGILFAITFFILSGFGAYNYAAIAAIQLSLIAAIFFTLAAFFFPRTLSPLNKAWMKLGELMGKVVSPLTLGVIFFLMITPVAMIGRLFGRDQLRLKRLEVCSYWIQRVPQGPDGDSFKNQF